ncbi:MAG: putative nucleic acid-binding protein, contains PIN domain [Verrucomicrobia bacterium]|nr:MAG: putative nucleic acid-binding protein, contains PIN domain [Verrucomicrobiota bacterium]
MVFFDTNIFIYIVSAAPADQTKRDVALRLMSESDFGLSVQILQEFMDVTLRKKQLGLTHNEIAAMIRHMVGYPLVETSVALAQQAFKIKIRHGIRYWDAAIIAAALELGCHTVYSEDLNHGQDYGGVTVINPFL